ncbi:uncharacterized protein LOC129288340 [Prosopis cineraria]|uniref:uncharacterized protein LOC129288340 n=1 Tax=Prosopis cineraria TaxID=364024 RepID=UPI0024108777|nr:uncharacterized protein LOC129288340 [Prosopis cineraria]
MARNASLEMLFFLLIVLAGSHPSLGWEFRKLGGADPSSTHTTDRIHDSPLPTSDPRHEKLGNNNKTDPPSPGAAPKVNPSSPNNSISPVPPPLQTDNAKASGNSTSATPPPVTGSNDQKSDAEGMKSDGQTFSQLNTSANCDRSSAKCRDQGDIVACISEIESKYVVIIVQNGGDSTVKVKLLMESSIADIEVSEHRNKKINVSVTSSEITKLTLNAGKGECVLHLGTPVPEEGIFFRLPSYEKVLTPINGAYFLIVAVLIFGGTWACCKFRKKQHDGVPYQELEMALPESVSATNVEIAEGWDQDWDDNWDEDVAVKSPGRPHAGSISANGLTARSSNKDGWENNWDD